VLAILGLYVFGNARINFCYHRSHPSRTRFARNGLNAGFAVLGVCCVQDTPARWVAVHRRIIQHADEQPDPHSPLVNFCWGHMGWVVIENDDLARLGITSATPRTFCATNSMPRSSANNWWIWVVFISWGVFFCGGVVAETLLGARRCRRCSSAPAFSSGACSCAGFGLAHHLVGSIP